jgi:hypothetical protein
VIISEKTIQCRAWVVDTLTGNGGHFCEELDVMTGSSTIEYYHRKRLLRRVKVTEDFFRISSSPDAAILVPGLENYAVTIDARNSPYRVKSRSDRPVFIDGKALERDVWTEWPTDVELAIEPGLSFVARCDVVGEAGAEATDSPNSNSSSGQDSRAASEGTESGTAKEEGGTALSGDRLHPGIIGGFVCVCLVLIFFSWSGRMEAHTGKQVEETLAILLTDLSSESDQTGQQGEHSEAPGLSEDAIRYRFALNQLRYARFLEQQDRHQEKKAAYKLLWDRCDLEHATSGIDLDLRKFVEGKK